MMAAQEARRLEGWSQIAAEISRAARLEVSVDQAMRFADRENDPLPVRRIGRYQKRKRIVAEPDEVVSWTRQEFGK